MFKSFYFHSVSIRVKNTDIQYYNVIVKITNKVKEFQET